MVADKAVFQDLLPDKILNLVEDSLGLACNNICRQLNSYINRVYEIQLESGDFVIVKFYRPDRWSKQSIIEEHEFTSLLATHEINVIPALPQINGNFLNYHNNLPFVLFPKIGGRIIDEFSEDQWLEIGRLIGRVHAIGKLGENKHRALFTPKDFTQNQVEKLLTGDIIPFENIKSYERLAQRLLNLIEPLFQDVKLSRIHGDCHFGNLLYRPNDSFYIFDFDDMVTGPCVQDLWMLLPGYKKDCYWEIELFIEGYETFLPFDRKELVLIEPLRAMRHIHFSHWLAHQVNDGVKKMGYSVDICSQQYWQQEINDLHCQIEHIKDELEIDG